MDGGLKRSLQVRHVIVFVCQHCTFDQHLPCRCLNWWPEGNAWRGKAGEVQVHVDMSDKPQDIRTTFMLKHVNA
jgi:hypothetical protein